MGIADKLRARIEKLGPGSKAFISSLSLVTIYFALSKVFSSIATVIVARYLGAVNFGEAQIIVLLGQMLSLFMLLGMHIVVMRYSAGKKDPTSVIATTIYVSGLAILVTALVTWLLSERLGAWLDLSNYQIMWAVALGTLFCLYLLFTSIYQALHYFKQRGMLEVVFAMLMLPGLVVGHLLTRGSYETLLIAYAVAYGVSLLPMLWKFRDKLHPRHLFAPELREMLSYGSLACICNIGYVLTFVVQPIQLQHYQSTEQVGIFRLYCYGSINMAAFATSIISTVFFPKISASKDRGGVWNRMTRAWGWLFLPLVAGFTIILTGVVLLGGDDYPLIWSHILLFATASTLITIQATYAQVMSAEGVRGMGWGLLLSVISGGVNLGLSALLIPRYGITGAVLTLIINYAITMGGTFMVRDLVMKRQSSQEPGSGLAE